MYVEVSSSVAEVNTGPRGRFSYADLCKRSESTARCNVRRDREWGCCCCGIFAVEVKQSLGFTFCASLPVAPPNQALIELGVGSSFLSILNKLTQVRGWVRGRLGAPLECLLTYTRAGFCVCFCLCCLSRLSVRRRLACEERCFRHETSSPPHIPSLSLPPN